MEGLIFGGAYLRRENYVSKSIGLAFQLEGNLPFLLCFRAIFNYKPPPGGGAYILRGDLTEGFLPYEFGGLVHGGAYFRNFTVFTPKECKCKEFCLQTRLGGEICSSDVIMHKGHSKLSKASVSKRGYVQSH